MSRSQRTGAWWRRGSSAVAVVAALTIVSGACATNPATGRREFSLMSEAQEVSLGVASDVDVRREMGVYADKELQDYVTDIGVRLARTSERPDLPWHFTVVDSPAVNAFAIPGGYIYITRGILPFLGDEAQLAGVLGHEIGHVTARHSAQQYSRTTGAGLGLVLGSILVPGAAPFSELASQGLGVLLLKYGRDDELEADALGVRYASRAGWDPSGVPGMLTTLGRIEESSDSKGVPNWLSTHPLAGDRVERVQAAVRQARTASTTLGADRDGFLRRVDGLVYGDDPKQGLVRGHRFLHPDLRLAVEFPQGWSITNGQSAVVATQPGTSVFVLMQPVQAPAGTDVQTLALSTMQANGYRSIDGERTSVGGLEAYVGTYSGTRSDVGRVTVRAAHIVHGERVYVVAGVAPAQAFASVEREVSASVRSFRALTPAEAEGIHPNRIDLQTARGGDTWASLAERQGKGVVKASTLAIMNGHAPGDEPRAGERLKIVVPG